MDDIIVRITWNDWKPLIEIDDLYTMIQMVRSRHLVGVLPESFLYPDRGLVKVPFSGAGPVFYGTLVSLKDSYRRAAVEEFFSTVQPNWFCKSDYTEKNLICPEILKALTLHQEGQGLCCTCKTRFIKGISL